MNSWTQINWGKISEKLLIEKSAPKLVLQNKLNLCSGYLTLWDFATAVQPLMPRQTKDLFAKMVDMLKNKKNLAAEEIKFDPTEQKDFDQWEISSWSTLNLVPQGHSSEIAVDKQNEEPAEEGEIKDDNKREEDVLNDLLHDLPDFYHLIPKRHFK